MEHPLATIEQTNKHQRSGNTSGLRHRLGKPYCFFSSTSLFGEVPQFGQTLGHIAPGEHSGKDGEAEALIE